MKRFLGAAVALLLLCAPAQAVSMEPPAVSAVSAILVDAESGRVLFEKNTDEKRMIASITKLMTALVAVESTPDLTDVVTVKPEWTGMEGTSIYLKAGEQITLEGLLYGLLLASGNDAAVAIAGYCAGDVDNFVDWMNQRAASLGMTNTHFQNPNGLNDDNNYSTAADMAKLAGACLENEMIAKIVSTKSTTVGVRSLTNHNKLLWQYDGCIGLKTGYTKMSGRTLVSAAKRGKQTLIAVTLCDPDDWDDHAALFDYGFEQWPRIELCAAGKDFRRIPVSGSLQRFATVRTNDDLAYPLCLTEQVTAKIILPDFAEAPVTKGAIAGCITYYLGQEPVGKSFLVYTESVHRDEVASGLVGRILEFFREHKSQPVLSFLTGIEVDVNTAQVKK